MKGDIPPPSKEGKIPFEIPSVDQPCFTNYKAYGDLQCGRPVVVGLHGGPGGGLKSSNSMACAWSQFGFPVVLYDQIGCGESSLLLEKAGDEGFWQMPLFMDELANLLERLKLCDGAGFILMGASFGGMLAADYATTRPRGLRKLVLCSPNASRKLSQAGQELRWKELPPDAERAIREANDKREFDTDSYKKALVVFYKHAVLRSSDWPPGLENLLFSFYKNHVYQTASGPAPTLLGIGGMRDWTVIPRLHLIDVPTLVWNGEYDASHDISVSPFFELIPRVRWVTFADAGHGFMGIDCPARDRATEILGRFLLQEDGTEVVTERTVA
ncbi:hypothetical protein ANO11243_071590 [Dothideomycetidae sp. 11243]|nr:hypothetical protein ANO11243_071590 [fungal sp. No.11243]